MIFIYFNILINLAGQPAIIELAGKLFVTIAPAPTMTLSPSSTPGNTHTLSPNQTLFPIFIGLDDRGRFDGGINKSSFVIFPWE